MDVSGKKSLSDTPCIGICSTSLGDPVCMGCGRTLEEVAQWNTYSDEQKIAINLRLNDPLASQKSR